MKITLYRSSGAPIENNHKEAYMNQLNKEMDDIESVLGKCTAENAEEFAKTMEVVHRSLTKDYPNSKRIQCPTSPKEIEKLCEEYGSVAFCMEEDKLVLYILDK